MRKRSLRKSGQREKSGKKTILFVTAAVVVAVVVLTASAFRLFGDRTPPTPPRLAAAAYALIDINSGMTLHEHGQEQPLRLGSLTKLMAVYICFIELEGGTISLEDVVTISSNAAGKSGSIIDFGVGAQVSLDALIYSTLLASGNDAVTAISEFIFGDENTMVDQMNRMAAELGMKETRFTDCTGINSFDNRSTTRDLTLLVTEMLRRFPQITEYTVRSEMLISFLHEGVEYTRTLKNTNSLLDNTPGVYGLKTGTAQDSHNAIVLYEHGRRNYMAIVMNAPNDTTRWSSIRALLDYGVGL